MAAHRSPRSPAGPKRDGTRPKKPAGARRSAAQVAKVSSAKAVKTGSGTAYRRAPLTSLRVFVAVAEHRSFTRGADALGLTTSAASMQVQALEEYLRIPL